MKRFENRPCGSGGALWAALRGLLRAALWACSGHASSRTPGARSVASRGAHVNPPSGGLGPPMRTLTHLVEPGHSCPGSTSRAQLRIDGLTLPPRGPRCRKPPQADASSRAICDGTRQTAARRVTHVLRCGSRAHVNPPGGGLGPPTRTLTHLVAAGHSGPSSTSRAQLRIDGLTLPPRGPRCRKPPQADASSRAICDGTRQTAARRVTHVLRCGSLAESLTCCDAGRAR